MSKKMTPFEAGHLAGASADAPMDDFEMSTRHDDFIVGYIVAYSKGESVRLASREVEAMTAGELAYCYNVSLQTLLPHLQFDEELRKELRQAYADSARANAEDESFDEDAEDEN